MAAALLGVAEGSALSCLSESRAASGSVQVPAADPSVPAIIQAEAIGRRIVALVRAVTPLGGEDRAGETARVAQVDWKTVSILPLSVWALNGFTI